MAEGEDNTIQLPLFDADLDTYAREHWRGMPEFVHQDLEPRYQIVVSFATRADRDKFAALVGQNIYDTTRSIWYPAQEIANGVNQKYVRKDHDDA